MVLSLGLRSDLVVYLLFISLAVSESTIEIQLLFLIAEMGAGNARSLAQDRCVVR